MTITNLEDVIQADLETLKTLKPGIIPGGTFYEGVFFRVLWVFVLFIGLQLFACFIAANIGTWTTAPESSRERFEQFEEVKAPVHNLISDMHSLLNQHNPAKTEAENEIEAKQQATIRLQKQQAHVARLKTIREEDHSSRVVKMFVGVFFSSLFFTLFFIGRINYAVIFKYQFQPHLRMGGTIAQKIRQSFTIYFGVFGVAALISFNFFEQDWTLFAGVPAFILATFITVILMEMELSRLGVSTLIRLLSQLFKQGNKTM